MKNTLHTEAAQFADYMLKRLEVGDRLAQAEGRAELAWDLAYDAYLWRNTPGTLALGSTAVPVLVVRDGVEL